MALANSVAHTSSIKTENSDGSALVVLLFGISFESVRLAIVKRQGLVACRTDERHKREALE